MTGIGGFLPLEAGAGPRAGVPHDGAAALTTGRACWHVILRTAKPRRVLLPFYICDAMLAPLAATGTPFEFYAIDDALRAAKTLRAGPDDLLVVVNYFGVMLAAVEARAAAADGARVLIDDTQAFFRRGRPDTWSFNSARKFFGVPDGAFLYGPAQGVEHLPPSDMDDCEHLVARLENDDRGWELFKAREARIGIEPRAMSPVAARLLASTDMDCVRRRRELNFTALHHRLGDRNALELPLADAAQDGPMCYPFLAERDVDRAELSRRGVFVPTLWPEAIARDGEGFESERSFARRLLPLPIDQRYGADDMTTIARTVLQVLR